MTKPALYRPAPGRRALRPNGEPLPDSGEAIVLTPYWRRLLKAGDIEAVPARAAAKPNVSKSNVSKPPRGSKSE